jgi:hypothetical protein
MTRDDIITEERVHNLSAALIAVLNSDTESTPRTQFDPFDHITALSMVICAVAIRLGVSKEVFLSGLFQSFDIMINRLEKRDEANH